MATHCPSCGSDLSDEPTYCPDCGVPTDPEATMEDDEMMDPLVFVTGVALFGGFMYSLLAGIYALQIGLSGVEFFTKPTFVIGPTVFFLAAVGFVWIAVQDSEYV